MGTSIHRVVVRGHFADLTDEQRAALLAEVDDHEIFRAAYTEHGTFTYERPLVWFNLRYEVRLGDHDAPDADPAAIALDRAREQLDRWGIGHKHLRATATDLATIWDG